jgi:hypothetical protein
MKEKTKLNPKGAGRKRMFAEIYGKTKRISVSIPEKKEKEIKEKIEIILEPYKL